MASWDAVESDLQEGIADIAAVTRLAKEEECPAHLRKFTWPLLLGVKGKPDRVSDKAVYLPEEGELVDSCNAAAARLKEEFDVTVEVEDLVKVIVTFCQARGVQSDHAVANGWTELLVPFFATQMPLGDIYNCFYAFVSRFALRDTHPDSACYHMFRLLLLYHEPELCLFLDSSHVAPHQLLTEWFRGLFSSTCGSTISMQLWDKYLAHADPFLVFFLALVFVMNPKDVLMDLGDDAAAIVTFIAELPQQVGAEDLGDLIELGQHYSSITPAALRDDYFAHVFGVGGTPTSEHGTDHVMQLLCFDVSPRGLLKRLGERSLFLVDTRPVQDYEAGHLKHTSKHIDAKQILHDPSAIDSDLNALEEQAEQAAQHHICFMGAGADDDLLKMVVSRCLKRHLMHVTSVRGGYSAVFEHLKAQGTVNNFVEGTAIERSAMPASDPLQEEAVVAQREEQRQQSRFGAALAGFASSYREKTSQWKQKLREKGAAYSGALAAKSQQWKTGIKNRLQAAEAANKPYREAEIRSKFSIDDDSDDDEPAMDPTQGAEIDLASAIVKRTREGELVADVSKAEQEPGVVHVFQCNEVHETLLYPTHLALTRSHIIKLRELETRGNHAVVMWRRPLTSILRITAKKKHPTLLSFLFAEDNVSAEAVMQAMARQQQQGPVDGGDTQQAEEGAEAATRAAQGGNSKPGEADGEGAQASDTKQDGQHGEEEEASEGGHDEASAPATSAFAIDDDDEQQEEGDKQATGADTEGASAETEAKEGDDEEEEGQSRGENEQQAKQQQEGEKPAEANQDEGEAAEQSSEEAKKEEAKATEEDGREGSTASKPKAKKRQKLNIPGTSKERYLVPQAAEAKAVLRDMIVAAREEEERFGL